MKQQQNNHDAQNATVTNIQRENKRAARSVSGPRKHACVVKSRDTLHRRNIIFSRKTTRDNCPLRGVAGIPRIEGIIIYSRRNRSAMAESTMTIPDNTAFKVVETGECNNASSMSVLEKSVLKPRVLPHGIINHFGGCYERDSRPR